MRANARRGWGCWQGCATRSTASRISRESKARPVTQYVYRFGGGVSDGGQGDKALLGGKGANLAEMASIGLPVPPGFTISTALCQRYYDDGGAFPEALRAEVGNGIAHIE